MTSKRDETKWQFRGVHLPAEMVIAWMDGEIADGEMKLLVFVEATVEVGGNGCHASNGYIARSIGMTLHHVSTLIKSLKEKGFLRVIYVTEDGEESEEYSKGERLENRYLETCWSRVARGGPFARTRKPPFARNRKQIEADTNVSPSLRSKKKKTLTSDNSNLKNGEYSQIDRKLAKRLYEGLRAKNKIGDINISKWASYFTKLRKYRTVEQIEKVMEFHIEHIRDTYEPKCYSAASFCSLDPDKKSFIKIEDAMERAANKHQKKEEERDLGW